MNRPFIALVPALCLALAACGPGKVEQCNALADAGNASQSAFVALQAAMLNEASFQTRIDKIEAASKTVKDVKVVDPKLIEMRDRYAKGLEDYSATMKLMKPILKKDDKVDDLNKHIDTLNAISDKESKLIDEINGYCGAT